MNEPAFVREADTSVFVRELDRPYPLIDRAEGVWLYDPAGRAYLDAVGGGAMVASVGHGVQELVEAARTQASRVSFLYNQQFTTAPQEELARELLALAPAGFTRVHFVTGGAEANETAVRLARSYHVERGEPDRWRIVSPAQAYHGPTAVTLSLTGRPGLHHHYTPLPDATSAYPARDVALRPERRGRARSPRPRARRGGARNRLRILLRARQRRCAACLLPADPLLGRPGRAARAARVPHLPGRGGHRHGPDGDLVRRRPAPLRPGP